MPQQIDALLDADGDLPVVSGLVTGIDLVAQRIRLRLLRGQGEWFVDPSKGLPLLEWRQQKPPQVSQILVSLQQEIRLIPGVVSTSNFQGTHDPLTRRLTISGDVLVEEEGVLSVVVTGSQDVAHNTMHFGIHFYSNNLAGHIPQPSTRGL
jgi:hypothetical protein